MIQSILAGIISSNALTVSFADSLSEVSSKTEVENNVDPLDPNNNSTTNNSNNTNNNNTIDNNNNIIDNNTSNNNNNTNATKEQVYLSDIKYDSKSNTSYSTIKKDENIKENQVINH